MKGIYAYWDNKLSYYVYIGKDSNIYKNSRHYAHLDPSRYEDQPFNRVLQNNPERYEYRVLMKGDYNNKQLNKMEKFCIKHFKTFYYDYPERKVFNFTRGGDGGCLGGKYHWNYGNKGQVKHLEPYQFKPCHKPWNTGKKRPEITREKNPNWKNYARIIKSGIKPSGKQQYKISYDGVETLKRSVDKESLKKWFKENYPNVELIDETKEEKQQ